MLAYSSADRGRVFTRTSNISDERNGHADRGMNREGEQYGGFRALLDTCATGVTSTPSVQVKAGADKLRVIHISPHAEGRGTRFRRVRTVRLQT